MRRWCVWIREPLSLSYDCMSAHASTLIGPQIQREHTQITSPIIEKKTYVTYWLIDIRRQTGSLTLTCSRIWYFTYLRQLCSLCPIIYTCILNYIIIFFLKQNYVIIYLQNVIHETYHMGVITTGHVLFHSLHNRGTYYYITRDPAYIVND